jgi:hypothetical protein
MEVQRNHEAAQVTNAYVAALTGRPLLPSVGDIVETLDDSVTDKAPCSGRVYAVKDGYVCVGWSDCLEVLPPSFNWNGAYYGETHDGRPYWCVGARRPRRHRLRQEMAR